MKAPIFFSVFSVSRECLICVCLLVVWSSVAGVAGGKITRPWQPPTVYLPHQAHYRGYAIIQYPLLFLNPDKM